MTINYETFVADFMAAYPTPESFDDEFGIGLQASSVEDYITDILWNEGVDATDIKEICIAIIAALKAIGYITTTRKERYEGTCQIFA